VEKEAGNEAKAAEREPIDRFYDPRRIALQGSSAHLDATKQVRQALLQSFRYLPDIHQ
jgi:hypothetical protein